jgi:hypothetical protein
MEAIRDGKAETAREQMSGLLRDSIGDVRDFLRRREDRGRKASAGRRRR